MASSPPAHDLVVVGAGIIGCACARSIADAGLNVVVVDPGPPGRGASSAAAGLLAPQYEESGGADPFFDLCDRSRATYPDFAGALREETGLDVELRREGMLVLALTDDDEEELERRLAWQRDAGLAAERVDADTLRTMEPLVTPEARWGLYLPNDIQVDNVRVCQALTRSLKERGVEIRVGDPVAALEVHGDRVTGVRLASGERLRAGRTVVAAGAWSAQIGGLPRPLPVRPIRGQMVELQSRGPGPNRILASRAGRYIVPRLDGRLLAGSTVEEAGFDASPSADGLLGILQAVQRIAPELRGARLGPTWAGLRPGTPDGHPILGPEPEMPGLIYATGHFRNGILLAPITALVVAELATDTKPRLDLSPFRPDRFEVDSGVEDRAGT
jgi:glycine oxidase